MPSIIEAIRDGKVTVIQTLMAAHLDDEVQQHGAATIWERVKTKKDRIVNTLNLVVQGEIHASEEDIAFLLAAEASYGHQLKLLDNRKAVTLA